MHYSIHEVNGQFFVWAEVEPEMYMQIAVFEFEQDAEFYIQARTSDETMEVSGEGMENALQAYLRAQ